MVESSTSDVIVRYVMESVGTWEESSGGGGTTQADARLRALGQPSVEVGALDIGDL